MDKETIDMSLNSAKICIILDEILKRLEDIEEQSSYDRGRIIELMERVRNLEA